ncbi:unnamed protein product, partial [Mesorhabditis belari]|uniref:Uncharacterized protein n=1 Tax=Mesorhabditis belari TaxID=2138241 RepID=A0AAF3FC35_9BILA
MLTDGTIAKTQCQLTSDVSRPVLLISSVVKGFIATGFWTPVVSVFSDRFEDSGCLTDILGHTGDSEAAALSNVLGLESKIWRYSIRSTMDSQR